jgi:hypothetical protein
MSSTPQPPYLLIREGKAFWVESRPPRNSSATLQAFKEGCFNDAWCYDATGRLWPIDSATLKRQPSFLQRVLPWRRVSVELQMGTPARVDVAEVVSRLGRVLRVDNEFCEYLPAPPIDILNRFKAAHTPKDIIGIAREYDGRATS